ncbi:MAG: putative membrane protein [Patescibacteria group bacterium]|jgi:uncharacterized membrane protein
MVVQKDILKRLDSQEKRILALEKYAGIRPSEPVHAKKESHVKEKKHESSDSIKLDFNQIITGLGVLGVVIGLISFFFYAVANDWIGQFGQIVIGICVGVLLFGFSLLLRENKEKWSNVVVGGSFFVFFLSIGVGVLEYAVISEAFGFVLLALFLIASTYVSIHFASRSIGYFTVVGGYLVPFISGYAEAYGFLLLYYALFTLGLVAVSFMQNWYDLRFVSYGVMVLFIASFYDIFTNQFANAIGVLFLIFVFVMYHASSLYSVTMKETIHLHALDNAVLITISGVILGMISFMFDLTNEMYGLIVLLFAVIYLVEALSMKLQKVDDSVMYTLIAVCIILANISILLLLDSLRNDYFMILFMVEYVLYSILAVKSTYSTLYDVFSKICLVLVGLWYVFIVRFMESFLHSLFFLTVMLAFVVALFVLFKLDFDADFNAGTFVISGFLFIYSFHKFVWWIGISDTVAQIVLSVLWLVYTLVLYAQAEEIREKVFIGILLGITLLKIAFNDLFYLDGAFRIVGFIIFGILLIVGGYFIRDDA